MHSRIPSVAGKYLYITVLLFKEPLKQRIADGGDQESQARDNSAR